jgi:hypothetical protein
MGSSKKQCPHCGKVVSAKAEDCPCGYLFTGYEEQEEIKRKHKNPVQRVIITDIAIPFSSLVLFMVTWAIAAIPAFLILAVLGFSIVFILGGLGAII